MTRLFVENVTSMSRPGIQSPDESTKLLDDVSFEIPAGKCLSVVGEQDSGKMALTLGLVRIDDFNAGNVWLGDRNVRKMSHRKFQKVRPGIQAVFPDSFGQLTEEFTLDRIFREILSTRGRLSRDEIHNQIDQVMVRTGLSATIRYLNPPRLDPVERQLAALARALLQSPGVIVLHDVTHSMDAIAQAEIFDRVKSIAGELDLTLLYLTTDIAAAYHMGDDIAILNRGKILETGDAESLINRPRHDYTKRLVSLRL